MLENNPDPNELSRIELLNLAHSLNISDADVMTRAELRTAIEKARRPEPRPPEQPVTWVSVARRLLASIVEQGLNLPDAAALIRGDTKLSTPPKAPPPVATVTLARIYAAQGHLERALRTIDEVLASDPDHHPALQLRTQLQARLEEQRRQADVAGAAATAGVADSEIPPRPGPDELDDIDAAATPDEPTGVAAPADEASGAAEEPADSAPPETLPELTTPAAESTAPAAGELAGGKASPASNGILHSAPGLEAVARDSEAPAAPEPLSAPPLTSTPVAATPELVVHPPVEVPIHVALADAPTDLPGAHAGSVAILPPEAQQPEAPSPEAPSPKALQPEAPVSGPLAAPEEKPLERAVVSPSSPGLVVIETASPTAYVYWEIATPRDPELANTPCWISVVAHTPTQHGSERRERRIPVFHSAGALRLEGVPRQAILRAKLAREQTPDARPIAVASIVRASSLALANLEPRFTPHARAHPQALAQRAAPHLDSASAVYW